MKNLRKLREEHGAGEWGTLELTNKYKSETPGQTVEEAKDYHAVALSASEHAKKQPSATTHKAASDAHEKAVSWHERKINALIKKDGQADEIKKHEQHIKMHKNEAQKHRFNAHRLGKAQQNEGHTEDAQSAHQAAHAALKKNDIETYHKEMDKKFAAHQAAEKEAAKKPVKTFEATEFKPDPGRLALVKRDHEDLKNKSTKEVLAIHQGQNRVRANYTAAEAGGKHAMIGDILRNRHGEKHVSHHFAMNEDTDEQKNLKITKHEKAAVEAEKRGDKQAQQFHLNAAKNLKTESTVTEATNSEPQKHIVTVTVSDPQHAMITQRKAKIMKRVKVSATDPKDAVAKAEAHYKKHGFKVHDSLHHSIVKESLDTDEIVDAKQEPSNDQQLLSMARGQLSEIADMAKELVDAMDETDDLEPWMNAKITTAYVNLDDVHSFISYGDEYSTDNNSEKEKNGLGEAVGEIDSEEKAQIAKIQTLIRLGLLDISELPIALRVMKKLASDQPINAVDDRKILIKLFSAVLDHLTDDDLIFRRVKMNVQKQ